MVCRVAVKWLSFGARMKYLWPSCGTSDEHGTAVEFRREEKSWCRINAAWCLVGLCRDVHIDLTSERIPRQKPDRYFRSGVELRVIGDGTDAEDVPFVRGVIAYRILDELSFASCLLARERVPVVSCDVRQVWRPPDTVIHAHGGKIHGARVDEQRVTCRDRKGIGDEFRSSIFRHASTGSLNKRLLYSNRIGAGGEKDIDWRKTGSRAAQRSGNERVSCRI